MIVHAAPSTADLGLDEAADALDALLPGLGAAVVDLLDAVHDRTDEHGSARPELLPRLADQLTRMWASTPGPERPLAVLDAVRSAVGSSRP